MGHAVYRLGGTDAVGIVSIAVGIKGLQLPSLLPDQGMSQICNRVALGIVGDLPPNKGGSRPSPTAPGQEGTREPSLPPPVTFPGKYNARCHL